MINVEYRARHREQRKALAPLAALAGAATASVATVGRRSAVVAVSSGLVMAMGAAPASADTAVGSVDVSALTAQANSVLKTAPVVKVSADAAWTTESSQINVTPAPKPVVVRTVPRAAARSTTRTAVNHTSATTAAPAPAQVAPPASANGNAIIEIASRYVGVPYVYGGSTPAGFDCSGFTSYVYAQVGISLPRTSSAQGKIGTRVSRANAQPGDLIWTPGHISIYAGGNTQIDAPVPGKTIQYRNIWQSNPIFIRVG